MLQALFIYFYQLVLTWRAWSHVYSLDSLSGVGFVRNVIHVSTHCLHTKGERALCPLGFRKKDIQYSVQQEHVDALCVLQNNLL